MMSHVMTTGVWCGMVSNIVGGIVLSTSAVESTVAGSTVVSGSTVASTVAMCSVAPTPCLVIETTSLRAGTSRGCCMSKCSTKLRGCRVMVFATVWCNRSCVIATKMPVLVLVVIHELWLCRTRTGSTVVSTAALR